MAMLNNQMVLYHIHVTQFPQALLDTLALLPDAPPTASAPLPRRLVRGAPSASRSRSWRSTGHVAPRGMDGGPGRAGNSMEIDEIDGKAYGN